MNRRIIGAGLIILLTAALASLLLHRPGSPREEIASPANTPHAGEPLTPTVAPLRTSSSNTTQESGTEAQRLAGEKDPSLLSVRGMLRDFRAQFGENPVGTNEEITRALLGKNPAGAIFESTEASVEHGHLVDRWHHPYFFHQISGTEMEIRSAGPDGAMWTDDDEVLR